MSVAQKILLAFVFTLGLLTLVMRFLSPGWSTLIVGPIDLVAVIFHWAIVFLASMGSIRVTVMVVTIISTVWLFALVGLQVDFGDGGSPWFVFMVFLSDRLPETDSVPDWVPWRSSVPFGYDLSLLATMVLPWAFMLKWLQVEAGQSRLLH